MITILSPAKRMIFSEEHKASETPQFLQETWKLARILRKYSPGQLADILKTSTALGTKAFMDYQDMDLSVSGMAALFAYRGLVFSALDADSMTKAEIAFAQEHLRILSGFYGLLKPLDGIRPYRLEMGHALPETGSLYDFWGDKIAKAIFEETDTVLNLASVEYSSAILPYAPPGKRVITCEFYRMHKGRWRIITTDAKKARGRMARWIIAHQVNDPESMQAFDEDGYRFDYEQSQEDIYRFYKD